jgi:glycosyltransferase involved in cell wall biosynthesis
MARLDRLMPPRVLQVVLSLAPGGTERLVIELATRLHPSMPMAICCLDDAGGWAGEVRAQGIEVHALRRRPGFRPGLSARIARIARAHRAGVIHAHHYSPFVYSALARVAGAGARVVYTEHGRLSDKGPSPKRRMANRVFARLPRAVFAVSEDLKAHIVAEGFPRDQVGVIYNGITPGPAPDAASRTAARARLGAGDSTFVLATIARLDPVKDLQTAIEAIARLSAQQPDVSVLLAIIGDGEERQRLEAAAGAAGIAHAVRFLGHRDDARAWLAGCDAYLNSSISEGVSLTILEAMAAGLPVVATAVGGTPEVVVNACGRLVPARDPDAVAAALLELHASPALRATLGRAARERVEARFTLDRMIGEYREVYNSATHPSSLDPRA